MFAQGKENIVLYVGISNTAMRVYDKVGFVGLDNEIRTDGVDNWLEVGFDRRQVDLGHW